MSLSETLCCMPSPQDAVSEDCIGSLETITGPIMSVTRRKTEEETETETEEETETETVTETETD